MNDIVAIDIGGTHARFALANVGGGRVASLGEAYTLKTAEHASLQSAWESFSRQVGRPLPTSVGISFAGPVGGNLLKLTNNPWIIERASLGQKLGVDRYKVVNDFGAVAHAVAHLADSEFKHVCGPEGPVPKEGVLSIVGPGTGLGVAQLLRRRDDYAVIETEGGHTDFAPLDSLEDLILVYLRKRYRRVSVERIVAGMGLVNIHEALCAIEGRPLKNRTEKELWTAALTLEDSATAAALDRFCLALGAIAGDIALTQGASAVVIAGGLGLRLAEHLPKSGFCDRFVAKGRFERRMGEIPVKLIIHPQPGLYGAAAAFAEEFSE